MENENKMSPLQGKERTNCGHVRAGAWAYIKTKKYSQGEHTQCSLFCLQYWGADTSTPSSFFLGEEVLAEARLASDINEYNILLHINLE